jgi:hypothetical protein
MVDTMIPHQIGPTSDIHCTQILNTGNGKYLMFNPPALFKENPMARVIRNKMPETNKVAIEILCFLFITELYLIRILKHMYSLFKILR